MALLALAWFWTGGFGLFGLLVLLLWAAALIDLLFANRAVAGGKKILWLVLIVVLPLLGSLVYLVVGRRGTQLGDHPDGYVERQSLESKAETARRTTLN